MGKKCAPRYCVCGCVFPQRLVMAIVCALGVIVCCGQRDEQSIGIAVFMHLMASNTTNFTDVNYTNHIQIEMSNIVVNLVLSAFPVGHFIGQLPAGLFADELGARWLFFSGVTTSTVLTFMSPGIIQYCNYLVVFCWRAMLGISQGVMYPCISVLLVRWTPVQERGKLGGMTYAMYPLAMIIANAVGEALRMNNMSNWHRSFYTWGGAGVLWCLICFFLVYDSPQKHPRITEKELTYLEEKLPRTNKLKVSFKKILSNHGIWALIIGQIGHNFTLHLMMEDVPWNLNIAAKVHKQKAILTSLFAFVGFWIVSIFSGILMDYGVVKKHWNLKWTRRIATYINFLIPNTFLCITFYVRETEIALIMCYAIAILFNGPYGASFRINHMDISINFAGTVTAIINLLGDVAALVLFMVLRIMTRQETVKSWEINTWVAFGLNCVCTTHYLLAAQVERADWDFPAEERAERVAERQRLKEEAKQKKEEQKKLKGK